MVEIHRYAAEAVLGLSLITAIWGGVAWALRRPSVYFWYILRAAQIALVVQVVLGMVLLLGGEEPKEGLHVLYGVLPLFVMMAGEAMRVSVAARIVGERDIHQLSREQQHGVALAIVRRETGIMAVASFLVFALAIRAAMTAGYF